MWTKLKINEILFGATEYDTNDWRNLTEDRIIKLTSWAAAEISARRASVQPGFTKLIYPSFSTDILAYQEFKRRWMTEVVPAQKPEAL